MNIDSLAQLIESSDISSFRTLSLEFLNMIGFSSVHYCDGPYDGGKDFKIYEDKTKQIKLAIQISTEKDWRKKLEQETNKIKNNYEIDNIIFISSRRIPENSFQEFSREILINSGVHITRYDNQSISSEFIKNNKVSSLLGVLGLKNIHDQQKRDFSPKHEAIASVLVFGSETKKFRDDIFDNIIKSYLSTYGDGIIRDKLIDLIIQDSGLAQNQSKLVNSHIDRLLQQGAIYKKEGLLFLHGDELNKFRGLKSAGQQDYLQAKTVISNLLTDQKINLSSKELDFFFDNLTEFIISLYASQVSYLDKEIVNNQSYLIIREILKKTLDNDRVEKLFEMIADEISRTPYGIRISATALYLSIINTNSEHLIEALGGRAGAIIFLDASVTIPMACSLLFDKTAYRYGYSAHLLYKLIKDHKFTAVIPDVYVEEIASHLIEACRDYKQIIEIDEDLSYSSNAFVSHYSRYRSQSSGNAISFEDYAQLFGVKLNLIKNEMTDHEFFRIRDESKNQISSLLSRYGISTEACISEMYKEIKSAYIATAEANKIKRPEILFFHDARVVCHLHSAKIDSDAVKILCTWDNAHFLFRSVYNYGYEVLNPISIIDLFSLAKPKETNRHLSALSDFAMMQSQSFMKQGSKIWDEIVAIDKGKFSDAEFLLKAKKFKDHYLKESVLASKVEPDEIAKAWEAWKNTK